VAGYWLEEVKSIDEAVEWIKRCPNPMLVDSCNGVREARLQGGWVSGNPSS
jgi:hypothetical protein